MSANLQQKEFFMMDSKFLKVSASTIRTEIAQVVTFMPLGLHRHAHWQLDRALCFGY